MEWISLLVERKVWFWTKGFFRIHGPESLRLLRDHWCGNFFSMYCCLHPWLNSLDSQILLVAFVVLHNIRCLNKEMSIFMIENMNGHFLGHVSLMSSEGVTLFQNRLLLLFCPTLTEPERVLRDVTDLATVAMVTVYYCFHSSGSQISATYLLPSGKPTFYFLWYSRNSTNDHLSTLRPFFWADSPHIDSCFNLSTMATFFCPHGDRCREVQL